MANDDDSRKTLADLIDVMAALRTPVTGCPWDLEQSYATIAPYTIEEAYEVADAIERGDLVDLKEELGDLLLQVVFHARLAEEEGAFAFPDVAHAITTKMLRRHPHVFGDDGARRAGAVPGWWERIKAEERAAKAKAREALGIATAHERSLLDDVPAAMPALTRALKLQEKAARVGFDWPTLAPVVAKLREELAELEVDLAAADGPGTDGAEARAAAELGDLLFAMVNVARHMKVDPEAALRAANDKFKRRFRHIEQGLAGRGSSPEQSSLAEMDALWEEAKTIERGR